MLSQSLPLSPLPSWMNIDGGAAVVENLSGSCVEIRFGDYTSSPQLEVQGQEPDALSTVHRYT